MTARREFNVPRGQCIYCNGQSGIIDRTQAATACYCRSQLQSWFPKTSTPFVGIFSRGERFVFPVISGRGIIAATRYPWIAGSGVLPHKEI